MAFATVFRDLDEYACGFITYSEGCNDDVNKVVWSCLGWNPDQTVDEILAEYAQYFIGPEYKDEFAKGLLMLEKNWQGPVGKNSSIYPTLDHFQNLENDAAPQLKLNWRFQQTLYRAYYDAYVKARYDHEMSLEKNALSVLQSARKTGSLPAVNRACEILADSASIRPDWRCRIFALAEALYQSIRMQLSVPLYGAKQIGRGANLDMMDTPLNHRVQLTEHLNRIRNQQEESKRLIMIDHLLTGAYRNEEIDWEDRMQEHLQRQFPKQALEYSADELEYGPPVRRSFCKNDIKKQGLFGFRTNQPDFHMPVAFDTLQSGEQEWVQRKKAWAGYWTGYIESPATADVCFTVEADAGIRLMIHECMLIDGLSDSSKKRGRFRMQKGMIYPVRLWSVNSGSFPFLKLYWQWDAQSRSIVNPSALFYSIENENHAAKFLDDD